MITSKTSFLALIGNPVTHSLSPVMQNAAIKYLGLDLVYLAFSCKNEDFNSTIESLKKINCKGLNITIPFKEKVFKLCHDISPIAHKIKAINTLKLNSEKEWSGTNTDVAGFMYPLEKYDLTKKKGTILGSGGAARAAIQGLVDLKVAEINIISRNENSMENIIRDFSTDIKINGINNDNITISDCIKNSDVIVNSTPVGMSKVSQKEGLLPFGEKIWESLRSDSIIYDLIYNPKPTALLKFGNKKNCITIDGSEMLVAQGAKSLSYWTGGLDIPIHIMKEALKDYL